MAAKPPGLTRLLVRGRPSTRRWTIRAQIKTGWERERLNDALDALYRRLADTAGGGASEPAAKPRVA